MPGQLDDLRTGCPELAAEMSTMGGAWDHHHGEGLAYRRDRFDRLDGGRFWISATPDRSASLLEPNHWGPRITVWVRLRDRGDGREFLFASTHFDTHPGCLEPSARIVTAELARLGGGLPMILGGDFNSLAGGPAWREFTARGWADAWRDAGRTDEGVITYNGFRPETRMPLRPTDRLEPYLRAKYRAGWEQGGRAGARWWRNERMDWLLFRGPWRATSAFTDTRLFGGRCASDHFAVAAVLEGSAKT